MIPLTEADIETGRGERESQGSDRDSESQSQSQSQQDSEFDEGRAAGGQNLKFPRGEQSAVRSSWRIIVVILILGASACAAFIGLGISAARRDSEQEFTHDARQASISIQGAAKEYEAASLWIHQAMRNRDRSRQDFRELYEHLHSHAFARISFLMNVTHLERPAMEEEARLFLKENYPDDDTKAPKYIGFKYQDPSGKIDNVTGSKVFLPSPEADSYFPIRYIEPFEENMISLDHDLTANEIRKDIDAALATWKPVITSRRKPKKPKNNSTLNDPLTNGYRVMIMHPGIPLSTRPDLKPRDLSNLEIHINALLKRATQQNPSHSLYLYDTSGPDGPVFLGGVLEEKGNGKDDISEQRFANDLELSEFHRIDSNKKYVEEFSVVNRQWTVAVVCSEPNFDLYKLMVVVGGATIFVVSACLALWVYSNARQGIKINEVKRAADKERAAIRVESANQATRAERELNGT